MHRVTVNNSLGFVSRFVLTGRLIANKCMVTMFVFYLNLLNTGNELTPEKNYPGFGNLKYYCSGEHIDFAKISLEAHRQCMCNKKQ